jgi:hypothetical protein
LFVEITGGTGAGQTRRIASNTATTITVSPAWSVTPSTDSDFEVNPEVLYGSTNIVEAVAANTNYFSGRDTIVAVGTNDGSDGGGVTILGGYGSAVTRDMYHADAGKTDSGNAAWSGTNYDDIQAIDYKANTLAIGALDQVWSETSDRNLDQQLDYFSKNFNLVRQELVGDVNLYATNEFVGVAGGADLAEYSY